MALRILHIDTSREWHGGQQQLLLLAEGLRRHGHEPLVVGAPHTVLAQRLRARGLAVATARMRASWDLTAARRLRALVRTWHPDVIHAHDIGGYTLALGALVAGPQPPLVLSRLRPRVHRRLRVTHGARVACFVASCTAVRDALIAAGIDDSRVTVVPPGVPAPPLDTRARDWRTECHWPADAVVCGVAGDLATDENEPLLTAIASLLPEEARARARLLLLGGRSGGPCVVGGVTAFRAGFVDDVSAAIAGVDLLWYAPHESGLGMPLLRAMTLGVPGIAFAVGCPAEYLQHEQVGLLAPAREPRAFAAVAARAIADGALRRSLGQRAREHARAFAVARMVGATERVYESLVAPR